MFDLYLKICKEIGKTISAMTPFFKATFAIENFHAQANITFVLPRLRDL